MNQSFNRLISNNPIEGKPVMKRTLLGAVAVAALVSVCGANPASANAITNGSFETGDFTGWTLAAGTGSTAAVANALDFVYPTIGGSYSAEDGTDFAMLGDDTGSGATLTQSLTAKYGGMVYLTYFLASDGYTGNSFSVTWDGTTVAGSAITNLTTQTYTEYQFLVSAVVGSNTLQFLAEDGNGFLSLDNVSVVPEPGSVALLGAGLIAAVGFHRRRRSQPAV